MFFKKKKIENNQPDSSTGTDPVFIIGSSPLALYLALKLQNAGDKAVIATLATERRHLRSKELTLKEEHNLQKSSASLPLVSIINKKPKLIIVAADSYNLKSHLTLLPGKTYPGTPLICFSRIYDLKTIRPLFGDNFCKAYFKGALSFNDDIVSLKGSAPKITLSRAFSEDTSDITAGIFQKLNIELEFSENDRRNFWYHFAPYALSYLAATPLLNISELLKNKDLKKELSQAAVELETLAAGENIDLRKDEIIKVLAEIPTSYNPKLPALSPCAAAAELDSLYTILSDKARIQKKSLPTLNRFFKNNYDSLLKK